jgi:hypothetical protein
MYASRREWRGGFLDRTTFGWIHPEDGAEEPFFRAGFFSCVDGQSADHEADC